MNNRRILYAVIALIVVLAAIFCIVKLVSGKPGQDTAVNNTLTPATNEATNTDANDAANTAANNASASNDAQSGKVTPTAETFPRIKAFTIDEAWDLLKGETEGMTNAEVKEYLYNASEKLFPEIEAMHKKILAELDRPAPEGKEVSWTRSVYRTLYGDYYKALMAAAEKEYEKEALRIDIEFEGGTGAGVDMALTRYSIYRTVLEELNYRYEILKDLD